LTPNLGGTAAAAGVAFEAVDSQPQTPPEGGDMRLRNAARRQNETRVEVTTNVEGTGGISEREAERIAERKAEETRRELERKIDQ
jgi:hypothetical protein